MGTLQCHISLPAESMVAPSGGVCTGPGCCPEGPSAGQRLRKGIGWHEGPCGTSPCSGSLWLFPHLAGAQGSPGHGWYGDNLCVGQGCSQTSFLTDGCRKHGAPRDSFHHSFLPRTRDGWWGSPAHCTGWFLPRFPAGCTGSGGPDAGAHAGDAPSASRQAAGSAAAAGARQRDSVVIDGLFITFWLCSGC